MGRYLKNYGTLNIAKADETIVSPNVSLIANIKILHLNTHTKGEELSITGDSLENARIAKKSNTISFTVMYCSGSWYTYEEQCEDGMTLYEFTESDYNTNNRYYHFDPTSEHYYWGHISYLRGWGPNYESDARYGCAYEDYELETVIEAGKTYYNYDRGFTCLLDDTNVLMSDGTTKQLKDIELGDYVLSLDLTTGEQVSRKVIYKGQSDEYNQFDKWDEWEFSDGTIVKTVNKHEFYNVECGKFKYLHEWEFGEHTNKIDGTTPALVKHTVHIENKNHVRIKLEGSTNYFANGLLTGDRYCNELDINLK